MPNPQDIANLYLGKEKGVSPQDIIDHPELFQDSKAKQYAQTQFDYLAGDTEEFHTQEDPNKRNEQLRLASSQSKWEKAGNFLVQAGIGEIIGGTISGVGAIGEIFNSTYRELKGEDADFTNRVSQLGEDISKWSKDNFPIHLKNPHAAFAVSDFGWWMQGFTSTASTVGLMLPGLGTVKTATWLARLAKMSDKVGDGAKYWGKVGTTALTMRNAENLKESLQVSQEAKKLALDELGKMSDKEFEEFKKTYNISSAFKNEMEGGELSKMKYYLSGLNTEERKFETKEEVANFIAAKAGWRSYRVNSSNIVFDVIQSTIPFTKAGTRLFAPKQVLEAQAKVLGRNLTSYEKVKTLINPIVSAPVRQGTEGIEEIVNTIGGEEGRYYAKELLGKEYSELSDRLKSYAADAHTWESGFWGITGGVAFEKLSNKIRKYINKEGDTSVENRIQEIDNRKNYIQNVATALKDIHSKYADETGTLTKEGQELVDTVISENASAMGYNSAVVGNTKLLLEQLQSESFKNQIINSGVTDEENADRIISNMTENIIESEQIRKKYFNKFLTVNLNPNIAELLISKSSFLESHKNRIRKKLVTLNNELSSLKETDNFLANDKNATTLNTIHLEALKYAKENFNEAIKQAKGTDIDKANLLNSSKTILEDLEKEIADLDKAIENKADLTGLNPEIISKSADILMGEKAIKQKSNFINDILKPEYGKNLEQQQKQVAKDLDKMVKDVNSKQINDIVDSTTQTANEKITNLNNLKDKLDIKSKELGIDKDIDNAIKKVNQLKEIQRQKNSSSGSNKIEDYQFPIVAENSSTNWEQINEVVTELNTIKSVGGKINGIERYLNYFKEQEGEGDIIAYLKNEKTKLTNVYEEAIRIEYEKPKNILRERRSVNPNSHLSVLENSANVFIPNVKSRTESNEQGDVVLEDSNAFDILNSDKVAEGTNVILKVDKTAKDFVTGDLLFTGKNTVDNLPIGIYTADNKLIGYVNDTSVIESELKEAIKIEHLYNTNKKEFDKLRKDVEYNRADNRTKRLIQWKLDEIYQAENPSINNTIKPLIYHIQQLENNLKNSKEIRSQIFRNQNTEFVTRITKKTSGSIVNGELRKLNEVLDEFPLLAVPKENIKLESVSNYSNLFSIDNSNQKHTRLSDSTYTNSDAAYSAGVIYTLVDTMAFDKDGNRIKIPTPLSRNSVDKDTADFITQEILSLLNHLQQGKKLNSDEVSLYRDSIARFIYVNQESQVDKKSISFKINSDSIEIESGDKIYTIYTKPTESAIKKGVNPNTITIIGKDFEGKEVNIPNTKKSILSTSDGTIDFENAISNIIQGKLRNVSFKQLKDTTAYKDPITNKVYKTYKDYIIETGVLLTDVGQVLNKEGKRISNVNTSGVANLVISINSNVTPKGKIKRDTQDYTHLIGNNTTTETILEGLGITDSKYKNLFELFNTLGVKINVIEGQKGSRTTFNTKNNTITISLYSVLNGNKEYYSSMGLKSTESILESVLAHEVLHGVLIHKSKNYPDLLNELDKFRKTLDLTNEVHKKAFEESGLSKGDLDYILKSSSSEVVTYAFTNPAFAKMLMNIPSDKSTKENPKSLWTELKELLKQIIDKVFNGQSKFDDLIEILDRNVEFDGGKTENIVNPNIDDLFGIRIENNNINQVLRNIGKEFNMNNNGFMPSTINYSHIYKRLEQEQLSNYNIKKASNNQYYLTYKNKFINPYEKDLGIRVEPSILNRKEKQHSINVMSAMILTFVEKNPHLTLGNIKDNSELSPKKIVTDKLNALYNSLQDTPEKEFIGKMIKSIDSLYSDTLNYINKTFPGITLDEGLDRGDIVEHKWNDRAVLKTPSDEKVGDKIKRLIATTPKQVYDTNGQIKKDTNTPSGIYEFLNFDEVYPYLHRNLIGSINVQDMMVRLKDLTKYDASLVSIYNKLENDNNLKSAFYYNFQGQIPDSLYIQFGGIEDEFSFKIDNSNKEGNPIFQLANKWISNLKVNKENGYYNQKNAKEFTEKNNQIKEALKSYEVNNLKEVSNLISDLYNILGIDLNSNVVFNDLKDKDKFIQEQSIDRDYLSVAYNIYKNREGEFSSYGDLNKLAKRAAFSQYGLTTNSYMDVEGNSVNSVQLSSFLGEFYKLINTDSKIAKDELLIKLKEFARDRSMKHSNWLWNTSLEGKPNGMLNPKLNEDGTINKNIEEATLNEDFISNMGYQFLDGSKNIISRESLSFTGYSSSDWLLLNLITYLNDSSTNFLMPIPIQSDSRNIYFIQTPKIKISENDYGIEGININSPIFKYLKNTVLQEIERMEQARDLLFDLNERGEIIGVKEDLDYTKLQRYYHYQKLDENDRPILIDKNGVPTGRVFNFHNIPSLNKLENLRLNKLLVEGTIKSLEDKTGFSDLIDKEIQEYLNKEIRKEIKASQQFKDKLEGKYTNASFNHFIAEYYLNQYIGYVEQQNFFNGNTSEYKSDLDTNKRAKELIAPGSLYSGLFSGSTFNVTTIKDIELESSIYNGMKEGITDIIKSEKPNLNDKELEQEIEKVIGKYKGINSGDAQGYITFERFKNLIKDKGLWGNYRDLVTKIEKGEQLNLQDLDRTLEVMKNYYYDRYFDNNTEKLRSVQLKYSTLPLIPQLINNSNISVLANYASNNNIDEIVFESAEKVGSNVITNIYKDGKIDESKLKELKYKTLSSKGLKSQLDVPSHLINTYNKLGGQVSKLIIGNLKGNYTVNDNKYSSKDLIKHYHNLLSGNITDSAFILIKRLGGVYDENGNIRIENNEKIRQILLEELEDRGLADNYKDAIKFIEGTDIFNLPLYVNHLVGKFESVLTSLFNNNIINQKLPGGTAVLASNLFMINDGTKLSELDTNLNIQGIEWSKEIVDREDYELKAQSYENGKVTIAEVLLPATHKSFFKNGQRISIDSIPEKERTMIGYRIPSDAKHQMIVFKVVGFLPSTSTSMIIAPKNIITQMGSDFDIDELFIIYSHIVKTKKGVKRIEYLDDSNSKIKDRYIRYIKSLVKEINIKHDINYKDLATNDVKSLYDKFKQIAKDNKDNENWIYDDEISDLKAEQKERRLDWKLAETSDIADEFNLPSFEQFKTYTIEQQNTKEARDNRILDLFIGILTNPKHYKELVNPSSFDTLTSVRDEIKKLYGEDKKEINPILPNTQRFFRDTNAQAISLKGMAANFNTFMYVAQVSKMELSKGLGIKVKYLKSEGYDIADLKKRYAKDVIEETNDSIVINHRKIGWNTKDYLNVDRELITDHSSQSLANILDMVKDALPDNVNTFTFNLFQTVAITGGNLRYASLFVNQPVIKEISELYFNNKGIFSKQDNSITDIKKKYQTELYKLAIKNNLIKSVKSFDERIEKDELIQISDKFFNKLFNQTEVLNSFSTTDLITNIENGNKTLNDKDKINYLINQLKVLNSFKTYLKSGRAIGRAINVFNTDNSNIIGVSPSFVSTHKLESEIDTMLKDNHILIGGINAVKKVFPDMIDSEGEYRFNLKNRESVYSMLNTYYKQGNILTYNVLSPYFINQSLVYRQIINSTSGILDVKYSEDLDKDISNFLNITILGEHSFFNDNKFEKQRILGINTPIEINENISIEVFNTLSLANKLSLLKKKNKDLLEDVHILNYLNPKLEKSETDRTGLHRVEFINPKSEFKSDLLTDTFKELYYSDNEFEKSTAIDLIKYSYYSNGMLFGLRNYSKIIPNDILVELGIGEHFRNYEGLFKDNSGFDINKTIENFVRQNHNNRTYVPATYSSIKNGKDTVKNGVFTDNNDIAYIFNEDFKLSKNKHIENKNYIKLITFENDTYKKDVLYKKVKNDGKVTTYIPIGKLGNSYITEVQGDSIIPTNNVLNEQIYLNIINGDIKNQIEKDNSLKEAKNHSMNYKMSAKDNLTNKNTSTIELIEQGIRTGTTRSYKLGEIGDVITFENRHQKYIITGHRYLSTENVKNENWISEWSNIEQWTPEYFKQRLKDESVNTIKIGNWQTLFKKIGKIENNNNLSTYIGYSGAAIGADTKFKEIGKEFGLDKLIEYTPNDLQKANERQREIIESAYTKAVTDLGRKFLSYNWNNPQKEDYVGGLVRRDYLQVVGSDGIFAISDIILPNEKGKPVKGIRYSNKQNKAIVDGGTGYAVQMGINLNKPVYVFHQGTNEDNSTKVGWYKWNVNKNSFDAINTPVLTKKFTGIGTREINERGIQAIEDVYNNTTQKTIKKPIQQTGQLNLFDELGIRIEEKHKKSQENRDKWENARKFIQNRIETNQQKISQFKRQPKAKQFVKDIQELLDTLDTDNLLNSLIASYNYDSELLDNLEIRLNAYKDIDVTKIDKAILEDLNNTLVNTENFLASFNSVENLDYFLLKGEKQLTPTERQIANVIKDYKNLEARISDLKRLQNLIRKEYVSHLKSYSTNPEILKGTKEFLGAIHDETGWQAWFNAMADTHNPMIANLIKKVNVHLYKGDDESKKLIKDFNKKYEDFIKAGGKVEDLLQEDKRLVQEFSDEYKTKLSNFADKLRELRKANKQNTREYKELEKEFNKFKRENIEQPYTDDYYEYLESLSNEARIALDELRNEESEILRKYKKKFKDDKGDLIGIYDNSLISEEDKNKLLDIKKRKKWLAVPLNEDGTEKKGKALKIAIELQYYNEGIKTFFEREFRETEFLQAENRAKSKGKKYHKKWLENNTKQTFTQDFWNYLNIILNDLGKGNKEFNREINTILNPFKDSDGNVDGSVIPSSIIERLFEIESFRNEKIEEKLKDSKSNPNIERLINELKTLVSFETTDYYKKTYKENKQKLSKEEFKQWYDKNHLKNPYTGIVEPIRAWTTIKPKDSKYIEKSAPTDNWFISKVKDKYINSNYREDNQGRPVAKPKWKNEKWVNMDNNTREFHYYLSNLLNDLLKDYRGSIINDGYLPAVELQKDGAIDTVVKHLGYYELNRKQDVKIFDENNNLVQFVPINFISMLGNQKELIALPERNKTESTINYEKRAVEEINLKTNNNFKTLDEVRDYNDELKYENKKIHSELVDTDIERTIPMFIKNAVKYKHKKDLENDVKLVREELLRTEILKTNGIGQTLKNKFRKTSNSDELKEQGETGKSNLSKHFDDWINRVFYEEYELDEGALTKWSRVLQNYTSIKGIGLNPFSGLNNIVYGRIQTAIESVAGYHFTGEDYRKANTFYFKGGVSYLADTWDNAKTKGRSSSIQNAIIKEFDIIHNQNELSQQKKDGATTAYLYFNNAIYVFQNIGEHTMQNQTLFAMMNSKRIVDGKLMNFRQYLDTKKHSIDRSMSLKKIEELSKENSKIEEEAKKGFEQYTKLIDAYELVDGYAQLKDGIKLNENEIGLFKNEVVGVNHKIHGIYNKEDKGAINKYWWGRLLLQFRNWAGAGWNKRFGSRFGESFWNERRNELDKGAYVSFFEYITQPIRDEKGEWKKYMTDEQKSVYNASRAILRDYKEYISNAKLYWHTLSDSDKANVKRTAMEMVYLIGAIVLLNMLKNLGDDDEELKDDKVFNIALYQLDRLKTELNTYTPFYGWFNESQKLLTSPTATWNTLTTVYKLMDSILGYPIRDEESMKFKGGIYHGQEKIYVYGSRLIPIWTQKDRIENIEKSNTYYKLY